MLFVAVSLSLVALATASGAVSPTCNYFCRNTTTGQVTIRASSSSLAGCCSGQGVSCPPGTVFGGAFGWNGKFIMC